MVARSTPSVRASLVRLREEAAGQAPLIGREMSNRAG
jgi:hypothetical protein